MIKEKESASDRNGSSEPHDDEQAIGWLGAAVISFWENAAENSDDPFEAYVYKCRIKVCGDYRTFCGKLRRGYRALLEEVDANRPNK